MAFAPKKKEEQMAVEPNKVFDQVMQPVAKAQESVRAAAEKGLTDARSQYESMKSVTEDNSRAMNSSFEAASKGFSELNSKAIAAVQANTNAAFEFVTALFSAKTMSEAMEIQTTHARKQVELTTAQSKEFAELAQRVGTSVAEPMKTIKPPVSMPNGSI